MGQKQENPLPEEDDDTKLAEQFGEFFLSKIINIRKLFHNISPYKTQQDMVPRLDKFSTIGEAELKTIINQMPNKSCQLDILKTVTLKKVIDKCIPAITRVINLSLGKRGFYAKWKIAVVKLLIKARQKGTIQSNYRPVSNLDFISKVVEKCALKHFNKHCDDYDLLPENQSTYRKHYSCETILLRMTNDILWNMENKLVTAVTLLDLSAAFDTVDHDILLEVLHNKFGIDGNALKWYSNYLNPRKFKVNINKAYSTEKTMQFSIPQGSVQGAFLFIAYTCNIS